MKDETKSPVALPEEAKPHCRRCEKPFSSHFSGGICPDGLGQYFPVSTPKDLRETLAEFTKAHDAAIAIPHWKLAKLYVHACMDRDTEATMHSAWRKRAEESESSAPSSPAVGGTERERFWKWAYQAHREWFNNPGLLLPKHESDADAAWSTWQAALSVRASAEVPERDTTRILLDAINWACGCADEEFRESKEGEGRYWWRNELTSRAELKYNGQKYVLASTPTPTERSK